MPEKAEGKTRTVAYLRVSTEGQDVEKNKADLLVFANERDFGRVEFVAEKVSGTVPWRERKIAGVIDGLGAGDRLIVPELSRLGRSMLEIIEVLHLALQRGIRIYAVKGGWELADNIQSKVVGMVLAMAAEIERDLISARTKEGLAAAKARGRQLGRPSGPGKSKLDQHADEIRALLANGSTKTWVAAKYGTTPQNLANWLRKNDL
jgi:DNA invertase Pin-like site-specific DNA recombinase